MVILLLEMKENEESLGAGRGGGCEERRNGRKVMKKQKKQTLNQ